MNYFGRYIINGNNKYGYDILLKNIYLKPNKLSKRKYVFMYILQKEIELSQIYENSNQNVFENYYIIQIKYNNKMCEIYIYI